MKHFEFLTGDRTRDGRNVDMLLGGVEKLYGRADLDDLLRDAVDSAVRVTGAQRGILLLADGASSVADSVLAVRVARDASKRDLPLDLPYSRSVANRVWTTGKADSRPDIPGIGDDLTQSCQAQHLVSIIAAPLPGRGRPVGVLYVDSQRTATGFTEGDRAVFEALAGLVATAIEQTRLAHTQRELDVARRIQRRMAPRGVPAPTEFDVAFEGMSAVETSGDYHDVIPLADGRLALVVGDVSGHGLGAALYMTSARAALHTLLRSHDDPLELLGDLNAYLCGDMEPSDFMTLFLGIVDPRARSLWWASAGHVSLHWRLGTGITELPGTGPALGTDPDATYRRGGPVDLLPGDAVVLCTDGIYEARGPSDEMYGEERLHASLAAHAARDPRARPVLDGALSDLGAFLAGRRPEDDVTLVVLRVLEPRL